MTISKTFLHFLQACDGRYPNSRGFSCVFGPDVTRRFLDENGLLYIVRSHECVQYGYDLCHDDTVSFCKN